jgi:hypothetical protein
MCNTHTHARTHAHKHTHSKLLVSSRCSGWDAEATPFLSSYAQCKLTVVLGSVILTGLKPTLTHSSQVPIFLLSCVLLVTLLLLLLLLLQGCVHGFLPSTARSQLAPAPWQGCATRHQACAKLLRSQTARNATATASAKAATAAQQVRCLLVRYRLGSQWHHCERALDFCPAHNLMPI